MASEQKLHSTDDKRPNVTTASGGESTNPANDSEPAGCCASHSGHKGEPVAQPVTAPPEDRREQVEGTMENEGYGVVTGGRRGGGEGAGTGERKKEEEEKATGEETSHQVTKAEDSGNKEEVPVGLLVSVDDNGPSEEKRADQGPQVTGEETGPQVTGEETGPQVKGEETGPQVKGEERGLQVMGEKRGPQMKGEERGPQVKGEETGPQVKGEERGPQVMGEETEAQVMGEETEAQVMGEETEAQVKGEETGPQVMGEERGPQVMGEEKGPQVMGEEKGPQVMGEETETQVMGEEKGPQVMGEETGPQVKGEETGPQVMGEERGPQVMGEEKGPQVMGEEKGPQVMGEETETQVMGEEKGPQVKGEERGPQVMGEEKGPQVKGEERGPQVMGEERGPQVTGPWVTCKETGLKGTDDEKETQAKVKETCSQSTGEETGEETSPQRADEDSAPQAIIPEVGENVGSGEERGAQVSHSGEKWIDMLVHTIVAEAAGVGVSTGGQVSVEASDTIAVTSEEDVHSTVQVTETETMTGEQARLQGGGAAAQVERDIAVHESGEKPGAQVSTEVKATPEQVDEDPAGIDRQVEAAAGAQVIGKEVQEEEGGQVSASAEEADREVTPDLDALPGREGTADQDRPVACREKEWPSLICTASEVRTVTADQGDTQQGSDTQREPSDKTPEMKEREVVEDGHSPTQETPIEREIRLAMDREMSLRQERGISSPIRQPELVEVRRRTISVEPMAVPGKERQLAGAQMQREIQLETQREQDLVELGKVMGTYDRGPQQELQERKMIFESMNPEPSEAPIKKKQSEPQQQSMPQEAPPSIVPVSNNYLAPAKETKKGPSYAEANGSNVIIIEHSSLLRMSAPGNTFSSAPADSHWSAPADSRRSAPADSRRSAPADPRQSIPAEISLTNSSGSPLPNSADSPVPPGSPYQLLSSPSPRSLLEREIEEVKERERELRRQRSSIYGRDDSVAENTQKTQEIPSDVQSFYQPERPSWGKLEVNWPPNKEAEMNGQQQVLNSPRNRRQRSTLIQSWESGNPNPKDDE